MRITIFGANGKVGRLVVEKSLDKGYKVVAFSHGKTTFRSSENLQIFQGDIYDMQNVEKAIKESEVVISTLGSWGTPNKDILTAGMKNIIPSMQRHNIKRIISLTGADAFMQGDKYSIISKIAHFLISLTAKKILKDGESHIQLLKGSDLDWTIIRSPVMNERGESGRFTLTNKKIMPWSTINRNSVALCMVEQINDHRYIKQAPYIKRSHA